MLKQQAFQNALPILERLELAGHEAYFVGGCVRDSLLGKTIADVDIATSAFPQEIQALFPVHFDVGLQHGTVMVLEAGETYEITTFRTESGYQDYRRPDKVVFIKSLAEDLKRRDFTINALALNRHGELIDFHDGQADLQHGILRAVGHAHERFGEDALRMMRAVRFAAQLDFAVATETTQAIVSCRQLLQHVSVERIQVEWQKLLLSKAPERGLQLIIATQLYAYIPGLQKGKETCETLITAKNLLDSPLMCWALLTFVHCQTLDEAKHFLAQWKLPNMIVDKSIAAFLLIAQRRVASWTPQLLFSTSEEVALIVERIVHHFGFIAESFDVVAMHRALPIHQLKDLAINGRDIMKIAHSDTGGKYIGHTLQRLKDEVLDNLLPNTREALLQRAKQLVGEDDEERKNS